MRGIIMAAGNATRLRPASIGCSKHLMLLYDKPMIYYSLSTLMLAGIREILIIVNNKFKKNYVDLLKDGRQFGLEINYLEQAEPNGVADVFSIAENFIKGHKIALILGDNIFHGTNLINFLKEGVNNKKGAMIFAYKVKNVSKYGVVTLNSNNQPIKLEEKPITNNGSYAVPGLYFFDKSVLNKAKKISPSKRGELEITDINKIYLREKKLKVKIMGRGMSWFDTGEIDSFIEASNFVRTIQNRQGLSIGCPEEIAWRNNWISSENFLNSLNKTAMSQYEKYIVELLNKS
tara:strand:+ start:2967 stop:3836 length:870 start_codon:yes stop_codon:yes gene_type:complete